jgi:dTDP-4-dehydrorhamnose 3,5-epimerase
VKSERAVLFHDTSLPGALVIEPEVATDERGFFARIWCSREFQARGLESRLVQASVSFNRQRGTLRGMHFQREPHAEVKLVRCTTGAIYDVVIDLRPGSPTFRRWISVELSAGNRRMLYIPKGFAHGFQTLEPDSEVLYFMTEFFEPTSAGGVRWNDSAFGIEWPLGDPIMSARDRTYPDFTG